MRTIKIAAMALAAFALLAPTSAQAAASHGPYGEGDGRYVLRTVGPDGKVKNVKTVNGTKGTVNCTMKVDYPHFSSGAGGVIYKTRVGCTGEGIYLVNIRVLGSLTAYGYGEGPSGPPPQGPALPIRTSNQTQAVEVNGNSSTYYTPVTGESGAPGNQWFSGWSRSEIVGIDGETALVDAYGTPRVFR